MPRKFARQKDHRDHMLCNLTTSLVLYERITTTQPKAKAVRSIIDRLMNIGKIKNLTSRRRLDAFFFDKNASKKIIEVLAPRYQNISSGFTRLYNIPPRLGDNASQMIIEFIPEVSNLKLNKKDHREKSIIPPKPIKNKKNQNIIKKSQ